MGWRHVPVDMRAAAETQHPSSCRPAHLARLSSRTLTATFGCNRACCCCQPSGYATLVILPESIGLKKMGLSSVIIITRSFSARQVAQAGGCPQAAPAKGSMKAKGSSFAARRWGANLLSFHAKGAGRSTARKPHKMPLPCNQQGAQGREPPTW